MDLPGGSVVKNLPAMQETQVQSLGQEGPLEKGSATHSSILGLSYLQCWRHHFDSWVGKIPWRRDRLPTQESWTSLVAQIVKNLPAMQEPWVQSLGQEEPLEECMATLSSILAWRIPMDRGAWQVVVHSVAQSRT